MKYTKITPNQPSVQKSKDIKNPTVKKKTIYIYGSTAIGHLGYTREQYRKVATLWKSRSTRFTTGIVHAVYQRYRPEQSSGIDYNQRFSDAFSKSQSDVRQRLNSQRPQQDVTTYQYPTVRQNSLPSPSVTTTSLMILVPPFKINEARRTYQTPVTLFQQDHYRQMGHHSARSQTDPKNLGGSPRLGNSNKATLTNHSSPLSMTPIASSLTLEKIRHKGDLKPRHSGLISSSYHRTYLVHHHTHLVHRHTCLRIHSYPQVDLLNQGGLEMCQKTSKHKPQSLNI